MGRVQEIMQGLQLDITVTTALACRVRKTSGVILKLDLKLEARKKRGTFHAEGRMCRKQEDWESRSWLVPIY